MKDSRLMACDRCKKLVAISDIRYLPKGKDSWITLCSDCRVKKPTIEETIFVAREAAAKSQASETSKLSPQKETSERISYICNRCSYKFRFNPSGTTILRCPYCGKSDRITKYEPPSADDLIKGLQEE